MKNLFKSIVLVLFVLTLSACGRIGDLTSHEVSQLSSDNSANSS